MPCGIARRGDSRWWRALRGATQGYLDDGGGSLVGDKLGRDQDRDDDDDRPQSHVPPDRLRESNQTWAGTVRHLPTETVTTHNTPPAAVVVVTTAVTATTVVTVKMPPPPVTTTTIPIPTETVVCG